jgi:hypothetical protein
MQSRTATVITARFDSGRDFRALGLSFLITGVVTLFGYAWFMKTKKAFADVR